MLPTANSDPSFDEAIFFLAGRNTVRNVIKINRRQAARGRRSSQDEVDSLELAKRERKREKCMIEVFDKDQVDADHGAGDGRTDSLDGATGRDIASSDYSPCGDDDGAPDFEGGQVEVFDVVSFSYDRN